MAPWRPSLSTVAFRMRAGDGPSRALLERVNATRRIFLSSTVIDGRYTLRICIVSHRTHADQVTEAVDIITSRLQNVEVHFDEMYYSLLGLRDRQT